MGSARRAQTPNPDFLSADRFVADLLDPVARSFRAHAGPFILQFPPLLRRSGLDPLVFLDGLDRFLEQLPRGFQYAVEVRDRRLLSEDYARVLARHGAAHVYNAWTAMPLPGDQADVIPVETMPFVMVRLLLRPGATYEQQREAFAPFDRLVAAHDRSARGAARTEAPRSAEMTYPLTGVPRRSDGSRRNRRPDADQLRRDKQRRQHVPDFW
ncbi:MAG TPA: DUF72 domain-containing protein [Vicinamibacterales bacterium]